MDEVEYLLHNFYLFILYQRLSSLRAGITHCKGTTFLDFGQKFNVLVPTLQLDCNNSRDGVAREIVR